tara:strand:- start:86 stop:385 length:300 start_codon:yes stop_codon:yes gene_type:complete
MDPENHQGSIKRHEVLGPSKDMRFWSSSGSIKRHEVLEGKTLKVYVPIGSIKRHEILKGENLDLGPSKDMRFLGPSKDMRFQEGKHKNGSIIAHEVLGP